MDAEEPSSSSPHPTPPRRPPNFSQQFAVAMELPFLFVGTIVIGGGAGWLLDRWLHTSPYLMILLGGLGFYAGLRELLRRLSGRGNRGGKPGQQP